MSESSSNQSSEIVIAKWSERFFAWSIDFCIISIISAAIISSIFGTIDYEFSEKMIWAEMIQFIPTSIVFFAYWIILDYKKGQTIGKKILKLKAGRVRFTMFGAMLI